MAIDKAFQAGAILASLFGSVFAKFGVVFEPEDLTGWYLF